MNNEDLRKQAMEALSSGDTASQSKVILDYIDSMIQGINARNVLNFDTEVLANRGKNVLTSEERKYYDSLKTAIKANQALTGIEMPLTIVERVFEDLQNQHELLQYIQFENVTGRTEILVKSGDAQTAVWGELTDEVKKELEGAFSKLNMSLKLLSAYLPISKFDIDLGPEWLDQYVRQFMVDAIYTGLEKGIIAGTGKSEPIGMTRDLSGAVVEGVYPEKEAVEITDLTQDIFGLFASLTNGGKRTVNQAIMVVNPQDYYTEILAKYMKQNDYGDYVFKLPLDVKFIQSTEMSVGKATIGLAKKYFAGIGLQTSINYSDHVKFLQNERVYLGQFVGDGTPLDNVSFINVTFKKTV